MAVYQNFILKERLQVCVHAILEYHDFACFLPGAALGDLGDRLLEYGQTRKIRCALLEQRLLALACGLAHEFLTLPSPETTLLYRHNIAQVVALYGRAKQASEQYLEVTKDSFLGMSCRQFLPVTAKTLTPA